MPVSEQNSKPAFSPILVLSKRRLFWRRLKLAFFVLGSTGFASFKWAEFMPTDAPLEVRFLLIGLFFLTFGWISIFFWSSLFGFRELVRKNKYEGIVHPSNDEQITSKTAILMPVYNEDSVEVFSRLASMANDLSETGEGSNFDFFILSDTTNPKIWVKEETLWLEAKKLFPTDINLFYRHRPLNTARKSGNIEDFCNRWGDNYDFMLVLDADSLMAGSTIVNMVKLMQVNPSTGIIQAPPVVINGQSFFARLNQFAGQVYGPIIAAGLSYWQAWDSNYWGHNAIIRTKAFISSCGLPILPGRAPFGGHILSHDFVEAALIRRAGWLTWLLPELKGSYEECPPAMLDFATRDRRWCQGNLQHTKLLFAKKIHPISRIHFTLGIMSYLSSPLWFLFLTVGIGLAVGRYFFPPIYFGETKELFPTWPVFDLPGTLLLFILSMAMLFLPKILGVIYILWKNPRKSDFGGFFGLLLSLMTEVVFSALIAPIMMLFQSKFVAEILLGLDSGWTTQNRSNSTTWGLAFSRHFAQTLIGILTLLVVYLYANSLFYWVLPITIGLMLSIPVSVLSSQKRWGDIFKKAFVFITPEEKKTPKLVARTDEFIQILSSAISEKQGFELLIHSPVYLAMHIYLLNINGPTPDFENKTLRKAVQQVQSFLSGEELCLSAEEERCCLYDIKLLQETSLLVNFSQE